MTTEAEIIPEPRTVLKADEEITKPISELKKTEGGLDMPAGTDECLDKANNVELASNGVETSDSKGESFSVSPEVSKVFEKTSEGDEKMSKIEAIADHDSTPEEKRESIEEEISHNAIEFDKQEGNLELKKQDSITNPDPIIDNSNEANEIVTEAGSSGLVQQKNLEEIKNTESEKLPALEGKAEGTEATDPIETSVSEKDQIISDSTEDILTSKAAKTSDIKDHETISEIREVAEKELQNGNPHEEIACVHEEVSKEPETDQHPIGDISNSSVSEGNVKESTKEEESIPLELTEKARSSVELEDSKKDTADLESAPATDETEEKRQETNNVAPAEECSTVDREASVVEESEKLASEPEVKEVEETKAVPTEIVSKPESKEVEETGIKAVATELASEPEVNEVEQIKAVATELVSEPEVNKVEAVPRELALEPEVNEVEETKAVAKESAPEPEVNEVEQTKAVAKESASEPEVNEVEQTKAVAKESASEPEVNEVEQTKAVASEPEVNEVEQTKAVASEPEVNEVEETKAVASEPEVNKVEQAKAVATLSALESKVNEVEQTKSVPETAQSSVKIEEDAEIVKHESAIEEACLQKEEESEPKSVSVEETIADEGLRNEEHEAKQTDDAQASITEESKEIETSALPSEKHETTQTEESKEIETSALPSKKHETTQTEETVVEAPEVRENEIIEKQMVSEDKSVQNPSQASSIMPIVEESSLESSQAKPEEIVAQEQPQVATIVPGEEAKEIEAKPEAASATAGNISLSDLLQISEEEKTEVAERVIEESEVTVSKEAAAAPVEDAENIQAKEAKTDKHNKTDSGSDAPVMVEAPRDTETKPHKKSQNIVSKAISKVKKAITGKSSSNSKEPKATSPKGGDK